MFLQFEEHRNFVSGEGDFTKVLHTIGNGDSAALCHPGAHVINTYGLDAIIVIKHLNVGGNIAEYAFVFDGCGELALTLGCQCVSTGIGLDTLFQVFFVTLFATERVPEMVFVIVAVDDGQHFRISVHCKILLLIVVAGFEA